MKITVLFCFILSYFGYGCGESIPEQNKEDKNLSPILQKKSDKTEYTHKNLTKQSPQTEYQTSPTITNDNRIKQNVISETVNSVANYGTGQTHLTIKKKQEEKLKKIQGNYNSKINDAIKE